MEKQSESIPSPQANTSSIPSSVLDLIEAKVEKSQVDVVQIKESKSLTLKEAKELRANVKMLRSNALYLIDITLCMGRGMGSVALKLEDVLGEDDSGKIFTLEKKQIKTTKKISNLLSNARNRLGSKRQALVSKYFKKFGEIFVVTAEDLPAVQEGIIELQKEIEIQKQRILDLHADSFRHYLNDIAEIAMISVGNDEEKIAKIVEHYSKVFPSRQAISTDIQLVVSPPLKLPSLQDLIAKDSQLRILEAQRETTELKERLERERIREQEQSLRSLQKEAEEQMRQHISQVIEQARLHFMSLVEGELNRMLETPPVNNGEEKRRFLRALEDIKSLLDLQDPTFQPLIEEFGELGEMLTCESYIVDIRKRDIQNKVQHLINKYQEYKYKAPIIHAKSGHRLGALAGLNIQ